MLDNKLNLWGLYPQRLWDGEGEGGLFPSFINKKELKKILKKNFKNFIEKNISKNVKKIKFFIFYLFISFFLCMFAVQK